MAKVKGETEETREADDAVEEKVKALKAKVVRKMYCGRIMVLSVAILLVIVALTWSSRTDTVERVISGIFSRSLDRLDTCKGETDLAAMNSCYRDLAFSTNSTYFCTKLFNATKMSETCYAKLAIDANSKKACDDIRDEKTRGYCLSELAVKKQELPLCDNIDDDGWKVTCYAQLALVTKKPEPCARIEDISMMADCYVALAKNITSGPTCAYIADSGKRDECYLAIASDNYDKLLCAEIQEPSIRWTCYHRVAVGTGETGLCNRIPKELNQNCFNAVRKAFP